MDDGDLNIRSEVIQGTVEVGRVVQLSGSLGSFTEPCRVVAGDADCVTVC